jgi:hypothetical protein
MQKNSKVIYIDWVKSDGLGRGKNKAAQKYTGSQGKQ